MLMMIDAININYICQAIMVILTFIMAMVAVCSYRKTVESERRMRARPKIVDLTRYFIAPLIEGLRDEKERKKLGERFLRVYDGVKIKLNSYEYFNAQRKVPELQILVSNFSVVLEELKLRSKWERKIKEYEDACCNKAINDPELLKTCKGKINELLALLEEVRKKLEKKYDLTPSEQIPLI